MPPLISPNSYPCSAWHSRQLTSTYSGAMYLKRAIVDAQKQAKAGVKVLKLTGDVGKAYLGTIYGAKWKQNAKYKYIIPFEKLKAMMYKE